MNWTEHTEEVLAMIEEERVIIRTIRKRQRKWIGIIGHMHTGDSLPRTVIEGKMEGTKTRGRPRQLDGSTGDGHGRRLRRRLGDGPHKI